MGALSVVFIRTVYIPLGNDCILVTLQSRFNSISLQNYSSPDCCANYGEIRETLIYNNTGIYSIWGRSTPVLLC